MMREVELLRQQLSQIQQAIGRRTDQIAKSGNDWPCRKGCDDCCRSLAAPPRVTRDEWDAIARTIESLPGEAAELTRRRIAESAGAARPVVCPLLDREAGACLAYQARPVACRAYGFYAERQFVLGCSRIEAIGEARRDIVWGNHLALEEDLRALGPARELSDWLRDQAAPSSAGFSTTLV